MQSASTDSTRVKCHCAVISRSIWKRLSSAWSSSTSRRGRTRAIWRTSSDADRAAGAGDEDALVLEVGADAVELHHHRVAAEHVLDLDLAQLAGELDAAAQELEDGRQGAHRDVALAALGDHLAAQHAGRRRDRDHDLVGAQAVEDGADLVGRPEHLEALGAHAALARVVVEEADRAGAEVRVELQLADHHLAAGAGADHEHLAARRRRAPRRVGRSASERRASRAPPSSAQARMKSKMITERGRLSG